MNAHIPAGFWNSERVWRKSGWGDASIGRSRRNEVQDRAREVLASYKAAVEGYFPPGHPLVLSLPRIYPLPGRTPEAVSATGTWNAPST